MVWKQNKYYILNFILTVLVGTLPFLIYFIQTKNGILPTADEWFSQGYNHGPWRWQGEMIFMYYPMLLMVVWSLALVVKGAR